VTVREEIFVVSDFMKQFLVDKDMPLLLLISEQLRHYVHGVAPHVQGIH
jgi:hypothetical protein